MGNFKYKNRRYKIIAKRPGEKYWKEWTQVDSMENAIKHKDHIIELGYLAKIIDRTEVEDNEYYN